MSMMAHELDIEEEINDTFDEINVIIDIPTRQLNRELFRAFVVPIVRNVNERATFPITFGAIVEDTEQAELVVDMIIGHYGYRLWPNYYHVEGSVGRANESKEQGEIRKSLVWYVRSIMGSQGDGPTRARSTQSEPDLRQARGYRSWVDVPRNDSCEQRLREEPLPWMREHLNEEEQRRLKRYQEADGFLPASDDGLDHDNNTTSGQQMQLPMRAQREMLQPSDSDVEDTFKYESDDSNADEARARCPLCGNWFDTFTEMRDHCEKKQCPKVEYAEEGETSGR